MRPDALQNSAFPPPDATDEEGVLGFSHDLNCELLLDAYYHGIFPWPFEEESILWASPPTRGILPLDKVHIPKSLSRELKKHRFTIVADTRFDEVIDACATAERPDGPGTWITQKMRRAYKEFHRLGYAHSFEALNPNGELVGGFYGVVIGKIFCGESTFYRESGASKAAFCHAFDAMRNAGIELIDTQVVTNLTESFGAFLISREEYQKRLASLRDPSPTPGIFS